MITASAMWANLKRDDSGNVTAWHSLVDHSADVAAVLLALLEQPTFAERLAILSGGDRLSPIARARLGALAFLHDIGKANRGFRARIDTRAPLVGHIDPLGWLFGAEGGPLLSQLQAVLGLERFDCWFADGDWSPFETAFAPHGRPWNRRAANARAYWRPDPNATVADPIGDLATMRVALDAWFADAFRDAPPLPAAPGFQHALAGLLMLADWLGSDTTFFPFADGRCPDRMAYARERASLALSAVGLNAEPGRALVRSARLDFTRTFGLSAAHPIQLETALHDAPVLVLEAETGSGKTEAALWRFAHLFVQGKVDGLYFALPTRVAASQIYNRLRKFRDGLFGDVGPPVVRAVPGQAGADGADGHRLPDFGFEWSDDPDEGERRARWAAEHPKRFLAAQLAAGTLDQALLGAITVKHAHLRGAALLRHLLVVDEVHASDTYMAGLLDALLRGQVAAGGQALLLSATLGAAARSRLLGTQVPNLAEAERVAYPALSWTETGVERQLKVASDGRCKHVLLDCTALLDHPAGIAQLALDAARQGARVLVVRNTVGGAIAVQRALEAAAGPDNPVLFRVAHVATLHHGRFAPADRRLLDAAVETVLGKDSAGGGKIVVGTQTLEQSLDIDADLLLTDLCPADVLLQRIGRLHRHAKRIRPNGFADPRTLVLVPGDRDLLTFARRGRHGLGAFVYEDLRVIEATWRLAEAHTEWVIPQMNRMLVERATHPEVLEKLWVELAAQDPAWRRHLEKVDGERRQHGLEAGLAAFDRTAPFSDFEVAEERCATRLGTADRQVAFAPAPGGPFAISAKIACVGATR